MKTNPHVTRLIADVNADMQLHGAERAAAYDEAYKRCIASGTPAVAARPSAALIARSQPATPTPAGKALVEIVEGFLSRRKDRGRRLSPDEIQQLGAELRAGRKAA